MKEVQEFGAFVLETLDTDFDKLVAGVAGAGTDYSRVQQADDLYQPVKTTLRTIAESMQRDDEEHLHRYSREIGMRRARDGFTLHEMQLAANAMRRHLWSRLFQFLRDREPWPPEAVRRFEDFNYVFYHSYSSSVGEALQQARAELSSQAEELEVQRSVIRELGVPVMPVHEGVLVLPLVGAIDSRRAIQVMEVLLEAITRYQSDMVIVDITGVPMVDTSVANYLLQSARAANLVGAHVILVGIGSDIAQTLIQLGVDLGSITTLANLHDGLAYAYRKLGYSLV